MKVWTSVDTVPYERKAEKQEIICARKRASGNWQEIELEELAERVGNQGCAFIPAHLVGGMKAENCVAMQLFALDFDEGVSFEKIRGKCEMLGLKIAFAYHTFSSSLDCEKFRVVFAHETLIEDAYIIRIVLAMLMWIFPECDKACKNTDRIFLGGKETIYQDTEARFALVQLLPLLYAALDSNKHFKRNLQTFCGKYKIFMINRQAAMGDHLYLPLLMENGDFRDLTIIHKIEETVFPPFFVAECKSLHSSITCEREHKRLNIT